jgi:hypothetical protein
MGLEGIVSKRALSPYKSGPSKFWLKTKNVVESELILLGTDYDNEGKPIAYLGKEAGGQLRFAGTAFLTLSGEPRTKLCRWHEPLQQEAPLCPSAQVAQPQGFRRLDPPALCKKKGKWVAAHPSLVKAASFTLYIHNADISRAQFPPVIPGTNITRPGSW